MLRQPELDHFLIDEAELTDSKLPLSSFHYGGYDRTVDVTKTSVKVLSRPGSSQTWMLFEES